jgi:hypothetical protein
VRQAGVLDRSGAAGPAGVVCVPVGFQFSVCGCIQQQREVLTPISGDNAIRARGLDLCDIRRKSR